ncbi:MAG: glycosyltransferase family 39 protein [Bacteroidota bacterium]
MNTPILSDRIYKFLFALLGLVYIVGLFVPLMDNDSAHHADIALRMYLTGDYVNLVDHAGDYLDKPHLHFWLCAFCYKIFGVTSFAYKLPSFLFTILGTYSTYRLGKALYNSEVGKLAALILASSFAYILANNDVRMDAILTACIVFSTWQLVEFVDHKKLLNIAGASLGLALGFSTKGHIAVFVPAVAALFYILYKKEWRLFYNWRWIILILLFALFISPVVYCYYLQYNLHPEKMVRGRGHINGVKFILLQQSVDRFSGEMGNDAKNDYFFFLHSFLWAFAPWSIIAYVAIADRIKNFLSRKEEWLTTAVFVIILLVVSFSGFKLPHYLNIVFPSTAVLTSAFIISKKNNGKWIRAFLIIQGSVVLLLLLLVAVINAWAFPVKSSWVIAGMILMLAVVFYFIKSRMYSTIQKSILVSVATMAFAFFLLNSNFYRQLLKYQGGNELAFATKGKVDPNDVYFWNNTYSSSYNFYTATLRKPFDDAAIQQKKKAWVLFDIRDEEQVKQSGYRLGQRFTALDYEITRLDIKFINPARRDSVCTKLLLAEISK